MEALLAFGGCAESSLDLDLTKSGVDTTKSAGDLTPEDRQLTSGKADGRVDTEEARAAACASAADSVLQALAAEVTATTSALEALRERVLSVARWRQGILAFRSNTELSKNIWRDLMRQQEATDVMLAALAPAGCVEAALMRSGAHSTDHSFAASASGDVNQLAADTGDMTDATTATVSSKELVGNVLDEVAWARSASLTKLRAETKVSPSAWDAKAWDSEALRQCGSSSRSSSSPRTRWTSAVAPRKGHGDDGGGQTRRASSTSRGAEDVRRPSDFRPLSGGRAVGRSPRRQRLLRSTAP